jgi:hypothetical protein
MNASFRTIIILFLFPEIICAKKGIILNMFIKCRMPLILFPIALLATLFAYSIAFTNQEEERKIDFSGVVAIESGQLVNYNGYKTIF